VSPTAVPITSSGNASTGTVLRLVIHAIVQSIMMDIKATTAATECRKYIVNVKHDMNAQARMIRKRDVLAVLPVDGDLGDGAGCVHDRLKWTRPVSTSVCQFCVVLTSST